MDRLKGRTVDYHKLPLRTTELVPLHSCGMVLLKTVGLLVCSNLFMTVAWYAHLKELRSKPWYIAAILSWSVAFFEYLLQVPANRIGFSELSLPQLKILQEVITLSIFIPFSVFYMKQPLRIEFLWASLCMTGAVYFMFRPASP